MTLVIPSKIMKKVSFYSRTFFHEALFLKPWLYFEVCIFILVTKANVKF